MERYYEHHLTIKKDKLCPFKLVHAPKAYSSLCNWHRNIEIFLIRDGNGTIQYGAEHLPLAAHDIVIVNSEILHRPYSTTGMELNFLIIDESFCLENGLDTSMIHFKPKVTDTATERLFLETITYWDRYSRESSPLSTASLRNAVLSLLIDLCSKHTFPDKLPSETNSPSAAYIKCVLTYLNEHYTQPVTLDTLAQLCGITRHHLAREFKKYMGQTVFTYLNMLRCKNAEFCLSEGMSVTQAAFESGFDSLSYFSRTYKKLMGVTPRSTRQ